MDTMSLAWRHTVNFKTSAIQQCTIWLLILAALSLSYNAKAIQLGPFESQQQLEQTIEFLNNNQIEFTTNDDALYQSLGYIVVTVKMDAESATKVINDLKSKQIRDFLYVGKGVYAGRISAGVFTSSESANRRVNQLIELGYEFESLERRRITRTHSLTIDRIEPTSVEKFEQFTGTPWPSATTTPDTQVQPLQDDATADTPATDIVIPATETQLKPEPLLVPEPVPGPVSKLQGEGEPALEPEPVAEPELEAAPLIEPAPLTSSVEQKQPTNIVIRSHPEASSNGMASWVPYLIIFSSVLIVLVLGYYYFFVSRKKLSKISSASSSTPISLEKVSEESERKPLQLDGSVGAISAYANQILSGGNPGEVPDYLATIRAGGSNVLDLIADIIELSRLEIGQTEVERISFDPESALQDLVKSLSADAEKRGISLHMESAADVPELIATDPSKLDKIMHALTSYALAHTDSGRVLIQVEFSQPREQLEISIEHNSDIELAENVFEPFSEDLGVSAEQHLRFAVSKRLANLMDGDIRIEQLSNNSMRYLLSIRADEVRERQYLLPNGLSIEQLVESEASNRELAQRIAADLEQTKKLSDQAIQEKIAAEERLAQETAARAAVIESAERKAAELIAEKQLIEEQVARRNEDLLQAKRNSETLVSELDALRSQAMAESEHRARLEKEAVAEIQRLNKDLSAAHSEVEATLESQTAMEEAALHRVNELEKTLQEAIIQAETETAAREKAEELARHQVAELSTQLVDAELLKTQFTQQLSNQQQDQQQLLQENQQQIDELQSTLEQTKLQLQSEQQNNNNAATASEQKLAELAAELEQASERYELEASNKVELQTKIESITTQLNEAEQAQQMQQLESEQTKAELAERIQHLELEIEESNRQIAIQNQLQEQALSQAHQSIDLLQQQLQDAEQNISRFAETEIQLEQTRSELVVSQQAIADHANVVEELSRVNLLLNNMETSLSMAEERVNLAEAELQSAKAEQHNAEQIAAQQESKQENSTISEQELARLQSLLQQAEQKLADETNIRDELEQRSATRVEALVNEVDQARASLQKETRRREDVEVEAQRQLDKLADQLEDSQKSLDAQARTHTELDRVNDFAKQTSKLLDETESKLKTVESEKQQIEQQLQQQQSSLDKIKAVAEQSIKAEQIAKRKLKQLMAANITAASTAELRSAQSDATPKQKDQKQEVLEQNVQEQIAQEQSTPSNNQPETVDLDIPRAETPPAESAPTVSSVADPIYPNKPMDNPIWRTMTVHFVEKLERQLSKMNIANQNKDYLEILVISKSIRADAFNLDIQEFEPVISILEQQLRQQQFEDINATIETLTSLSHRVQNPDVEVDEGESLGVKSSKITERLVIDLPSNTKTAELLENFIGQLGMRLLEVQSAWQEGNSSEVAKACRWVNRYGSKLALTTILIAAEELQSAVNKGDADRISQKLWNFISLYTRIDIKR